MSALGTAWQRLRGRGAAAATDEPVMEHRFDAADEAIMQAVRPYTMTSELRIEALLEAVRYVVGRNVPGAFAECGVWRGGSVLAMLLELQQLGVDDRDVYLYDTFEGMTEPTEHDTSSYDPPARAEWDRSVAAHERPWNGLFSPEVFTEDAVRELLVGTGYPASRVHLVKGPVEETLPAQAPEQLALLRLDTDWYESTRHELAHLYTRLAVGGVLIIDDYGHWDGCRRAVDEHFADPSTRPLLHRVDYTCRIGLKLP